MPVTIIVGGQYGSEGKGKVCALTASLLSGPIVIRCGGPNSGHTTSVGGIEMVLRQLPAASGNPDAELAIAAGCVIDEDLLIREVEACDLNRERILVDPRAVLLDQTDAAAEQALESAIGSTTSGTGNALARRMMRQSAVRLAQDSVTLAKYANVTPVAPYVHTMIAKGRPVIVEGTQGFGLSLLHGPDYPFVTSRDTTAAAFAMEVGLSPRDIDEVMLVVRTYPIRVGGNSGPLSEELTWAEIRALSGAPIEEPEFTSVTRRLRRVGGFNLDLVRNACQYNRPTQICVMGLDRLDYRNRNILIPTELTQTGRDFLWTLESELAVPVTWVGTGPSTFSALRLQPLSEQSASHV